LQQVQTGQAAMRAGVPKIAAELTFQHAINAARFLLGAQLTGIIRFAVASAASTCATFALLTRRERALVK
jgi:hypothetical protein